MPNLDLLNVPVPQDMIATREQSGAKLSYIEGAYAIRKANEIFGPMGWDVELGDPVLVQSEIKVGGSGKELNYVGYIIKATILATGEDDIPARRVEDYGFGQGIDADLGKAHESAIKEARTDAVKRCLKDFGDAFGLHLYGKKKAAHASPSTPDKPASGKPLAARDYAKLQEALRGTDWSNKQKMALNAAIIEKFPGDGSQSAEALAWAIEQIEASA